MRLTPRSTAALFALTLGLAFCSDAKAQFFAGGNSFDPEISVVESGALLDVQATVSHDRKYVTINARPQLSQLIALREFTFQNQIPQQPLGNVGQGGQLQQQQGAGNGRQGNAGAPPVVTPPPTPPAPTVLDREGMTRLQLKR